MGKHSIERPRRTRAKYLFASATGVVLIALAIGFGYMFYPKSPPPANTSATNTMSTIPNVSRPDTASAGGGFATWEMKQGDYKNNRWFSDGIAEIKNAKNTADARNAITVWVDKVKRDPLILAATAEQFLKEKVKKEDLVDSKGLATPLTVQTSFRLAAVMARADVSPGQAPANGTNSGVSAGTVVQASRSGVSGNRKAIKVVMDDGSVVWVLGRCGQVVVIKKMVFPPGVTEEELCPDERNPESVQPVQDNKKDQVAPTPGYPERGHGEEVVEQQDSEPKGGTDPTQEGTPGDGNQNASTPEGSGDGQTAKPPSEEPPAEGLKGETPPAPIPED